MYPQPSVVVVETLAVPRGTLHWSLFRSGSEESPRFFWRRDCSYSNAVTTSGPFTSEFQALSRMRNDRGFFAEMWASA